MKEITDMEIDMRKGGEVIVIMGWEIIIGGGMVMNIEKGVLRKIGGEISMEKKRNFVIWK